MTYCVAFKINEGLVFCSDSRTNAGPDRVSTYSKMHLFSVPGDRMLILLAAGNLATTQAVVAQMTKDMQEDADFNIKKARYVSEVADYIGNISRTEQNKYAESGPNAGFSPEASFIIGGQIQGGHLELFLVYPEGNHITPSEQFPYLQIGEIKYGKPILDRMIRQNTDHDTAMRCALVSMDSTMRSNATVGPPIELMFYPENSLGLSNKYHAFKENDEYLVTLRHSWDKSIRDSFDNLSPLNGIFENSEP